MGSGKAPRKTAEQKAMETHEVAVEHEYSLRINIEEIAG